MLTCGELLSLPKQLLQAAGGPSQADVYQVYWQGQPLIVKQYSGARNAFYRMVCRIQLRREWLALLKLRHVPNMPRPVLFVDHQLLVMTKLELQPAALNYSNARALESLVSQMHQAGVSHNDLHSKNLMLDAQQAYLFDFGTALFKPVATNRLLKRALFSTACFFDRMAVTKYKIKHAPHVLREEDRLMAGLVKATRGLSQLWYRIKQLRRQQQPQARSLKQYQLRARHRLPKSSENSAACCVGAVSR